MDYYINPDVEKTTRVFPKQGRSNFYRYDMNENAEGLPQNFVNKVLSEITPEFLAMYPESDQFIKKYASFIGVQEENVVATNGSDMAIRYLLEVFGERKKSVITVSPSFEMYRINCSLLGLVHIPVLYESDLTIDIGKLISKIDRNTRVVVLLNPNNPIGNVYTEKEVQQVIFRAREMGAIVIIDEAYYLFYSVSFLNFVLEYDNVIVIRTFSKLFSLAACRIGVIIGNKKLIDSVKKTRLSFDVNSIALLFAQRILEHPELIQNLIQEAKEGKQFILDRLVEKNYECKDCKGNYIFVKPKHDAHIVTQRLEQEKRVLVHPYHNDPLKNQIRVTIGSKRAMEIFLDAFLIIDSYI